MEQQARIPRRDTPAWRRLLVWGLWVVLAVPAIAFAQSQRAEEILAHLARGPALGTEDAPVTIIELSDFQCGYCRKFWEQTLPRIRAEYVKPGKVRFIYHHLPILGRQSVTAAQAADCAGEQGKFWEYHNQLFASQGPLGLTHGNLKGYARRVGLDGEVFDRCLDSGKYAQKVQEDTMVALAVGPRATPIFVINGMLLVGAHPFETFRQVIEDQLRTGRTPRPPAPVDKPPDSY